MTACEDNRTIRKKGRGGGVVMVGTLHKYGMLGTSDGSAAAAVVGQLTNKQASKQTNVARLAGESNPNPNSDPTCGKDTIGIPFSGTKTRNLFNSWRHKSHILQSKEGESSHRSSNHFSTTAMTVVTCPQHHQRLSNAPLRHQSQ